jgi:hypothetical protein
MFLLRVRDVKGLLIPIGAVMVVGLAVALYLIDRGRGPDQ